MYSIEELETILQNLPYARVTTMNPWLVANDGYAHIHVSHEAMVQLVKDYPLVLRQLLDTMRELEELS